MLIKGWQLVERRNEFEAISKEMLKTVRSLFLIGRGYQWATCLEGALKIKEIAYVHCEAIPAGELKVFNASYCCSAV